jgi:hypothetical protein
MVDVKDITGTGFVYRNALTWLIAAITFAIITFILIMYSIMSDEDSMLAWAALCPAVGAVGFWIGYYVYSRHSLFEITFAGGAIAFETAMLGGNESQNFQQNIRLVKDAIEEKREAQQVAPKTTGSIADEIKKYKELLDSGLISAEEFEHTRNKLLNKL